MIGLEYLCSLKNISYVELAEKLGVSKQTISNWVAGRRNINEKYDEQLKELFNFPIEWIKKDLNEVDKGVILTLFSEEQENEISYTDEKSAKLKVLESSIIAYLRMFMRKDLEIKEYSRASSLLESINNILTFYTYGSRLEYEILNDILDCSAAFIDNEFKVLPEQEEMFKVFKTLMEKEKVNRKNKYLVDNFLKLNNFDKDLLDKFDLLNEDIEFQISGLIKELEKSNDEKLNYKLEMLINKLRVLLNLEDLL
ncbi:TPA: helix-turn-helix transcriptional regulator [Clostridium perfringens]|nr:helix-turn-helix transcriptional regulator [Clostridium perfringens]